VSSPNALTTPGAFEAKAEILQKLFVENNDIILLQDEK
jgi:hypothetical protein